MEDTVFVDYRVLERLDVPVASAFRSTSSRHPLRAEVDEVAKATSFLGTISVMTRLRNEY